MAVSDAHVFPGFLITILTQISFQSHRLLFSHASAEVRGEICRKEICLNRFTLSQPPGHESDMLTTEPPRRGHFAMNLGHCFFVTPRLLKSPLIKEIKEIMLNRPKKFDCFHYLTLAEQ